MLTSYKLRRWDEGKIEGAGGRAREGAGERGRERGFNKVLRESRRSSAEPLESQGERAGKRQMSATGAPWCL